MEERYNNLELLEQPEVPGWFRKGEIDEVLFCQFFLALYPMH